MEFVAGESRISTSLQRETRDFRFKQTVMHFVVGRAQSACSCPQSRRSASRYQAVERHAVGAAYAVKIMDFGLAKSAARGESAREVRRRAGRRSTCRPSRFSAKRLDFRTDIYAFGGTVYHLLAGRAAVRRRRSALPPRAHGKAKQLTGASAGRDPQSPRQHRDGLPQQGSL